MTRSSSSLRLLLGLLPAHRRGQLVRLLLLMLLAAAGDLVMIAALVPFLSVLSGRGTSGSTGPMSWIPQLDLQQAALLFGTAAILAGALRLLLTSLSQRFASGAGHDISCEVQRRILLQPYSYHLDHHSSTAVAALQKVEELVFSTLLPLVEGTAALIIGAAILVLLLMLNPLAATLAIGGIASLYLIAVVATRRSLLRSAEVLRVGWDERVRLVGDSLGGVRDIIIDGSQPLFAEMFRRTDRRLADASVKVGLLSAAPRFLVESIGLVLIAVAAAVLARRSDEFVAALPLLGAMALAAQRLMPLLQQLYRGWAAVTARAGVVGDVAQLLSLPVPPTGAPPAALPFRQELRLDDVFFTYPSGTRPVLSGVSLAIRRGSRVALTGRTGSGKSTLADLIMGLLSPSSGALMVDGERLAPDRLPSWRRNVAHVPQSVFLTDDSLRANVAFGVPPDEIDEARVMEAIRLAQLGELLDELPLGLGTSLGERGIRLSGGQRQRVAIARAIYRRAPLLVLDEVTNALDPHTESLVLRGLDELQRQGTTIVLIAHRRSALAGCDREFHLDGGRLVERTLLATG